MCVSKSLIAKKSIISNAIFERIFAFPTCTHVCSNFRCMYRDTNKFRYLKKEGTSANANMKGKERQWRKERRKTGKKNQGGNRVFVYYCRMR